LRVHLFVGSVARWPLQGRERNEKKKPHSVAMPSANPHVHNHQPSRHKGTGLPAAGLAPWEEKRLLLRFFLVCAGFLRRSWYGAALLFRANRRPFSRRRRLGSPRSSRAGGLPVPAHGLGMVLFRTLAGCIRDTEVSLSAGLSLLGGLSLLRFGQGALRRLLPVHPLLHVKVPPRRLK